MKSCYKCVLGTDEEATEYWGGCKVGLGRIAVRDETR